MMDGPDELQNELVRLRQRLATVAEELHETQKRLALTLEASSDGYWEWDCPTDELYFSPSYFTILGYKPGEMPPNHRQWSSWVHPEDLKRALEALQGHIEDRTPHFEAEFRAREKTGNWRWLLGRGKVVERSPDGKPVRMVGTNIDIHERKQVQETLERERRTLRRMLRASDHERQLIAYDIHDGLAQKLAAALMQLQSCQHFCKQQPEKAKNLYEFGLEMLRQAHAEARRLISGVRPPILDESGITAAIAHLVHDQGNGREIEFQSRVSFNRLPDILENALYRIAQEALSNACKHSCSQKVRLSLVQENVQVQLEVQDWGVGFDSMIVGADRFGLEGIRERARLLGGTARIESELGRGTLVAVALPLIVEHGEDE